MIAGLSADDDAEWIDTEQRGLVLRVRGRRLVWFVSAARKLASTIRGRADGGQDPQQEKRGKREAARKRRLGDTVHSALASWLKDTHNGPLAHWKGGLEGGSARAILHHTIRLDNTLGKKLLSEITTKDLERFIGEAVAPATKNRCLGALRIFLGWAVRVGLIEKLPTGGIQRVHETPVLGHARPKLLRTYMPTLPLKEAREVLPEVGRGAGRDSRKAHHHRRAMPAA